MPNLVKPQDTHCVGNRKHNIMSDYISQTITVWVRGGGRRGGGGGQHIWLKNIASDHFAVYLLG